MPLKWSKPRNPDNQCSYNHVIAPTPLGDITIEWEGWKVAVSYTADLPWSEFVAGFDLDEAKKMVQKAWDAKVSEMVKLCEAERRFGNNKPHTERPVGTKRNSSDLR